MLIYINYFLLDFGDLWQLNFGRFFVAYWYFSTFHTKFRIKPGKRFKESVLYIYVFEVFHLIYTCSNDRISHTHRDWQQGRNFSYHNAYHFNRSCRGIACPKSGSGGHSQNAGRDQLWPTPCRWAFWWTICFGWWSTPYNTGHSYRPHRLRLSPPDHKKHYKTMVYAENSKQHCQGRNQLYQH